MIWSAVADKLGRRTIINSCETFVCCILFIVGSLHYTGATTDNAAAGTALVSPARSKQRTHSPRNNPS